MLFWHLTGEGRLRLPLACPCTAEWERTGNPVTPERTDDALLIPAGDRILLTADADEEAILCAFRNASLI